MKIAVFDVCGTLYNSNTTFDFLDNYFSKNKKYITFRKISNLFIVKALNHYVYKYMKTDMIKRYATSFLKGESIEDIDAYSRDFVYHYLKPKVKDHIYTMLKSYQNNGYKIILMSGSYNFIVRNVADYFKVDLFFASSLQKSDKQYKGKYKKDIILNKYQLLTEKFPDINDLVVVSDNKSDLDLMLISSHSFAICNKKKQYKYWLKVKNKKITIVEDYV